MLYRGIMDRSKWLVDRLLRRVSRVLAFHPVATVHLRDLPEPLFVRLGTSDWVVLEEIFRWGAYDALFAQSLGDVCTILDLGSNVGLSLRLWKSRFPGARLVAVEPDPANVAMLMENIAKVDDGVTVVTACAAGTSRWVWLDSRNGAWGIKMLDEAEGIKVRAMTVPQILTAGGLDSIDLLKCDIEGAEAEVFADCATWINQVRWLAIELHPPYNKDQFLTDLERNGSRLVVRHAQGWVGQEMLLLERQ